MDYGNSTDYKLNVIRLYFLLNRRRKNLYFHQDTKEKNIPNKYFQFYNKSIIWKYIFIENERNLIRPLIMKYKQIYVVVIFNPK